MAWRTGAVPVRNAGVAGRAVWRENQGSWMPPMIAAFTRRGQGRAAATTAGR